MSNAAKGATHIALSEAVSKGPPPTGNLAVPIFSRSSIEVEHYSPKDYRSSNAAYPDELYLIARGHRMLFDGVQTHEIKPGSFNFVAAGQVHRFESFSSDLAVWVVFYGSEAGDTAGKE
jgi:hypothetical protein